MTSDTIEFTQAYLNYWWLFFLMASFFGIFYLQINIFTKMLDLYSVLEPKDIKVCINTKTDATT